jgi:transcriptional regulator GlxA family with amidase domain
MPHTVVTVVSDGANAFEFSVACEVFGLDRSELGVEWYDFRLASPGGAVRIQSGAHLRTEFDLSAIDDAATVIVSSAPVDGPCDPVLLDHLVRAHARGVRLVSFCSGAFALAEAGLLDGRRATTHWRYTEIFRRRFPRVSLDPNVLFVDDGDVLTSAGTAAAVDLSLYVVRKDHGAEAARGVARRMVVPPFRDGGQAQYIDPPHEPRVDADGLAQMLDELQEELHLEVSVADMARRAAMSERTFARRFKEETGTTPHRWLLGQRVQRAQQLLETTELDVDLVAYRSGFGTAANLRQHFRRSLATTPSNYRRTFRGTGHTVGRHQLAST